MSSGRALMLSMARPTRVPGIVSERVAENVRAIRKRRNMSTYDLAGKLSAIGWPIHQTGVARIETGERRVDVDDLEALAAALDVTPDDLLADVGTAPVSGPELVTLQQAVIDALAAGVAVSEVRAAVRQALAVAASVTEAGASLRHIRIVDGVD